MEDLIEGLMRDNVAEVKVVLASVAFALAVYQLVLISVGDAYPARTSGARWPGSTPSTMIAGPAELRVRSGRMSR